MKRTTLLTALSATAVLTIALFALSLPGSPKLSPDTPGLASENSVSLAPGEAALRATINPETGEVEVSASQPGTPLDAYTEQALRRDTEGLKQVFHPNGAVSMHLQGRFQNTSVVHIDENGKLLICSESVDHVREMAHGHVTKPVQNQTPEVR